MQQAAGCSGSVRRGGAAGSKQQALAPASGWAHILWFSKFSFAGGKYLKRKMNKQMRDLGAGAWHRDSRSHAEYLL